MPKERGRPIFKNEQNIKLNSVLLKQAAQKAITPEI